MKQQTPIVIEKNYSQYGFREPDESVYKTKKGLSKEIVEEISKIKKEPKWMLDFRLKALEFFQKRPVPTWGADLSGLNFDEIVYYIKPTEQQAKSWDDLPEGIRRTFEKLGIPEAERKFLAGVGGQYDSESIYHKLKEDLEKQGVIFTDMDTGIREYPEIAKKYFGTIIPPNDNKFAALNSAVWSGGCLTKDTQIFVNDGGLTTISEIKQGQHVYSWNPKTNSLEKDSVVGVIHNGKKDALEIFVGGRTIKATGNHRFLKLIKNKEKAKKFRRSLNPEWIELNDIKEGDYIAISKQLPNGKSMILPKLNVNYKKNKSRVKTKFVPTKTNENLMWLLGVWLGDGHTSIKNNMGNINFALPKSDESRVIATRIIKKLFGYKVTTLQKNSFEIHSLALATWLRELGYYGNAHNKDVPNWVFSLPYKQKLSFIGGYLDSDGCLENDGKIASFSSVNRSLLEKMKMLGISVGLFSDGKITKRERVVTLGGRKISSIEYRLRFSGKVYLIGTRKRANLEKFMLLEKSTFDKYNGATGFHFEFLTNKDIGFAKIKKITRIGLQDVYDIQTLKNHNFVANGIIVHNSFVYVPEGVEVKAPLQAYFRINSENMGQFERTLIIAEPNSKVHYIEGCTAATYQANALHAAVVEIIAMPDSHVRYTTLQNWSTNVYNLVTKRARAYENAFVEWLDANLGSKITMKYPSVFLAGRGARAEILSIAFAGKGQNLDAGAKAIHLAPDTSSTIVNKSVSKDGGKTNFRGFVKIFPGAENSKSHTKCDALILDEKSNSETIPQLDIDDNRVNVGHEATVGKVGEEQLFYLMSRGLTEDEAIAMIVNGFFETFVKELPLEYAVEFNRLIQLEMTGAVG